MLALVPCIDTAKYGLEKFPEPGGEFRELFSAHGREVRGKSLQLDFHRYYQIEREKRLVWVVARSIETNKPIGYSLHYWYRDLHYFADIVGADDLWYVEKSFRKNGVGRMLKLMGHAELQRQGCVRTSDNIRASYSHHMLMRDVGFEPWGIRWQKELQLKSN